MDNNGVTAFVATHCGAHFFDPSGVLVTWNVWQRDVDFRSPDALDDVEIRPAQACAADPNDNVGVTLEGGIRDILKLEEFRPLAFFIVVVQTCSFHSSHSFAKRR